MKSIRLFKLSRSDSAVLMCTFDPTDVTFSMIREQSTGVEGSGKTKVG